MTIEENGGNLRRYCFAGLILAILTLAVLKKIYDYDIWYHLVIGREIFQTGRIPATEFFVYPHLGEPASFHEWGFGLFFYVVYRLFGYHGMGVANSLIGAFSLLFFYLAGRKGSGVNIPGAVLVLGLFHLIDFRLMYRPEMIFFLFLGAEMWLLEKFAADGRWKFLYAIPLLTALLNYFHPSALFLLAVLGMYCLQFVYDAYRENRLDRSYVQRLAAVLAAAFLAAGANPYGFGQLFLPLSFVSSSEHLNQVVEFLPTFQTPFKTRFLIAVAIAAVALAFQRKRRLCDWLLVIFFGWLGYRYMRNVALFSMVAYVPVARFMEDITDRFSFFATPLGKKTAFSFFAVTAIATLWVATMQPQWGTGVFAQNLPVKAAEIIAEMKPKGQIFNSYGSGGYLAWELFGNYRVSIDGRHYGMDKSFVENNIVFEAKPGWEQILTGYGVTMIFTPATSPYTGVLVDLLPLLDSDEGWLLVSAEPGGLLFMRREVLPMAQGWTMPDQNLTWWQVIREARSIPVAPGHAAPYLAMSIAYFKLHQFDQATDYLRKYVRLTPGDTVAAQTLAGFEQGVGFPPEAAPPSTKFRMY